MEIDINLLRSLVTLAAVAAFAGVVWWAYAPARRQRFERDALLPFDEEEVAALVPPLTPSPSPARGEGKCTAGNGLSVVSRVNDRGRP